jgi:hypothetical protein
MGPSLTEWQKYKRVKEQASFLVHENERLIREVRVTRFRADLFLFSTVILFLMVVAG